MAGKRSSSTLSRCLDEYSLRILAVDDNAINLKIITKVLLSIGCPAADTAVDGQSAYALATANHYDVIFLDVSLPDMDGIVVT